MQNITASFKSKRSIAIIGAGQAGLQLACGLLKFGCVVTMFSNRTSEQICHGQILSNQSMFDVALSCERELELNFWDSECPRNISVTMTLAVPNAREKAIEWTGMTHKFYQAVDQRLKFSRWMLHIQDLGGKIIILDVNATRLNEIAKSHDLTIIASGKGEISKLFTRDNERSKYYQPQRVLASIYIKNIIPMIPSGVRVSIIPGIGEYFIMPGLTLNGPCEMMQFEGIPSGDFDCWNDISSPGEQLETALQLLNKYVPWEAERCSNVQLTDTKAILKGQYTPVIRYPTVTLPCGKAILGIGDTVILNDPIAGQGSNNAAKAAGHYLKKIVEHDENEFTEEWMKEVFEEYWNQDGRWATEWSNLLLQPPEPHVIELLISASKNPEIANKLANGFDQPSTLFPWITDAEQTSHFIRSCKNSEMSNIKADDIYFS